MSKIKKLLCSPAQPRVEFMPSDVDSKDVRRRGVLHGRLATASDFDDFGQVGFLDIAESSETEKDSEDG